MSSTKLSFMLALMGVSTSSLACSPPPITSIEREADVIVMGSGEFAHRNAGGIITAHRAIKGRTPSKVRVEIAYRRQPIGALGLMCPTFELEGRQVGTFYLRRLKNGHFRILSFQVSR